MLEDYNSKLKEGQAVNKEAYQKLNADYATLSKKYKDLKQKH